MATKKKFKKMIKGLVEQMPTIMQPTSETVRVKGSILIAQGHTHVAAGEPVDPDKFYRQRLPVQIAFNHENRVKAAYKRNGRAGVTYYIKSLQHIVKNAS